MDGKVTRGKAGRYLKLKIPKTLGEGADIEPPYSLRELVNEFYFRNKFGGRNEDVKTSRGIISSNDRGTLLFYLDKETDSWYRPTPLIGGSGMGREYVAKYGAEGVLDGKEFIFEAKFNCSQLLKSASHSFLLTDLSNRFGQYVNDGKPRKDIVRHDLESYWFVCKPKVSSGGR